MTANSSDGVVEAEVMRRFLLQCADNNYGHRPPATDYMLSPDNDEGCSEKETRRSSSRNLGFGSRLEDIRARERELELEEMLQALDLDGDGKVSLDDFIRLLVLDQNNENNIANDEETGGVQTKEGRDETMNDCESTQGDDGTASNRNTNIANTVEEENEYQHRPKGCLLM